MDKQENTGENVENIKFSIDTQLNFMFLHVHSFFVVYPLGGLTFFLHFWQSWPTVRHPKILEDQLTLFKPVGDRLFISFCPHNFQTFLRPCLSLQKLLFPFFAAVLLFCYQNCSDLLSTECFFYLFLEVSQI